MMANILKEINNNSLIKIEPDAIADYTFILGDLNYRFKSTYLEHIHNVRNSKHLIPNLDELYESRTSLGRYPGYDEMEIAFDPTYKRDLLLNGYYINKKN